MKVCELYRSLQGEGSTSGEPTIFVRVQGCNLRCSYCDTTYAQQPTPQNEMPVDLIVREIKAMEHSNSTKLVEITGGEPMIFADEIITLAGRLSYLGFRTLVETNGSLPLDGYMSSRVTYVMDYKLPSSNMEDRMVPSNLNLLRPRDELKFVVGNINDFNRAMEIIDEYEPKCKILFSPIWDMMHFKELAELILNSGINARLSIQIHKLIWNRDKRGV